MEATKRVVIITDAPPHGSQYHDECDHYPNGSPEGLKLEDLMQEFCKKEIDFQVIKLDNSVDKTIQVMKRCHQEVDVVDMCGIGEEIRRTRIATVEASKGTVNARAFMLMRTAAESAPSHKEIET